MGSHSKLIQYLGYGGLIPFYGCAFLVYWLNQPEFWVYAIHVYASMIISFLGALSWGFALSIKDMPSYQRTVLFYWGVTPAVLGWVCLLLPQFIRVGPLLMLFVLTLAVDMYFQRQLDFPIFWVKMRLRLTFAGIFALILTELV
ncbi:DUF3429 domain-containing protein [Burkholderiales bacterium]|nr:DUF3429 domain-containing protein [Burkholderiales bacterium]